MLKASQDELELLPEAEGQVQGHIERERCREGQGQEHEDVDGTFESVTDERNCGEDLHRSPQYD